MGLFKTNQVKCDIGSYIHYWRGVKKSGKTTLFYDLTKVQYGDLSKGLLIAIGDEIGFQALDGLVYTETPDWGTLIEVIDELVENKDNNEFEIIGFDTVDEMVKLAKEEVKRIHKKLKGSVAEFNACLGGYGAGRDKVIELIDEQLARIRRAGYGIVCIGHTKIKDIKEKNGDEYQQLTSNLNADYDGIFANKADIVMTISVEKEIDNDKHINGTNRYMYFRSDGFVDAGGRFSNMPEKVEYGAQNYIDAFEEGVKGNITGKVTAKEIQKRKDDEVKERKLKAKKYAEELKENKVDPDRNAELIEYMTGAFKELDDDKKTPIKELMKAEGLKNFNGLSEYPTAKVEEIKALFD